MQPIRTARTHPVLVLDEPGAGECAVLPRNHQAAGPRTTPFTWPRRRLRPLRRRRCIGGHVRKPDEPMDRDRRPTPRHSRPIESAGTVGQSRGCAQSGIDDGNDPGVIPRARPDRYQCRRYSGRPRGGWSRHLPALRRRVPDLAGNRCRHPSSCRRRSRAGATTVTRRDPVDGGPAPPGSCSTPQRRARRPPSVRKTLCRRRRARHTARRIFPV